MIINGGARSGAKSLATHLLNQSKNERVQILDIRGCLATDLRGALVEIEESAEATRCLRPLYHANIDPDRTVKMTAEQWQRAIDALEEKLGLQDHARAVVMHQKHGREHIHVVWNRIDLETMRTVSDSHNYRKHELVARDLEREFGHERVQGVHIERGDRPRPERTPPKWAMQQGERLKLDARQVEDQVRQLWTASDTGRSFAAALTDQGFALAKGDRRDFIIVDQAAGVHSLGRCTATKAADVRKRMAEVDREALPTVEQAVALMRERQAAELARETRAAAEKKFTSAAAELGKRAPQPEPNFGPRPSELELDQTAADIRRAYTLSSDARSFANALEKNGIHLAAVTAKEAERDRTYRAGEIVAVNPAGQVYALDPRTTGDEREKIEKFLGTLDRGKLQGIEATQEEINLRAQQFMAQSQVGTLRRAEPEPDLTTPRAREQPREKIDLKRYITDRDYRREVQRQQAKEQPPPQRQRGPDLER